MESAKIHEKIDMLPDSLKQEVDDFVDFLISKSNRQSPSPKFGSAKGFYHMTDDFDEPLEDFDEYMP